MTRRLLRRFLLGVFCMTSGMVHPDGNIDTLAIPADGWRVVTDAVMGGVSTGAMRPLGQADRRSV